MSEDRVPLFVRLPHEQAAALDRLVGSTGRRKQQLVSELLGAQLDVGRIDIHESAPLEAEQVLTLAEVATLLRVPEETVEELARTRTLPARRLGEQWRFARGAVIDWLAAGEELGAASAAGEDDGN